MLRVLIAVAATVELAYFYIELPVPLHRMIGFSGRWSDILPGLCMAVLAPLIALTAMAFAAAGRFKPAGILLAVAPVVYWTPMLVAAVAKLVR